ncbi:QWRF motif-containing protein 7-like [Typha angustifolia]|uniref:QWRF motif-containing protein 7-like n=1 Tax=Typha angustifolia TaxID=59011 RepID=UPI003C2F3B65
MEAGGPRPRSPKPLHRSYSAAARFCHVPSSPPLSSNHSRSVSVIRSKPNSALIRLSAPKENHNATSPRLLPFPGEGEPRRQRTPRPCVSAWALSPGRAPPAKGRRGGGGGAVLGLFTGRRKEATGKEDAAHRLRMATARLMQWRFVNARAEAARERAKSAAEKKLFYAWLRVSEQRSIVAAKRIVVQRRKRKLKLVRVLNPQIRLLIKWEPLAKQHIEAVSLLGRVLGAASTSVPLVEGAQANMVSLYRYTRISMEIMKNIEANAKIFYSKAGNVSAVLCELAETIRLEIEGLEELIKLSKFITSLEMHELSLRACLIQEVKEKDDNID